ncbi:MAG: glycosyltransferase [Chloroflexi bacterium]|nr:glycosyltransferase [Chloroflexota bacterium]
MVVGEESIDRRLLAQFPESFWRAQMVAPLGREGHVVFVASASEFPGPAIEAIARGTGCHVELVLAPPEEVTRRLDAAYGATRPSTELWDSIGELAQSLGVIARPPALPSDFDAPMTVDGLAGLLKIPVDTAIELLALWAYLPRVNLERYTARPALARLLPPEVAHALGVLPVFRSGRVLVVAIGRLPEPGLRARLAQVTGMDPFLVIASPALLSQRLEAAYPPGPQERPQRVQVELTDLVESGALTPGEAQATRLVALRTGERAVEVAERLGYVDEVRLLRALARRLRTQLVDLADVSPTHDVLNVIPRTIARRLGCVALGWRGGALVVAMTDPSDRAAEQTIEELAGRPVRRRLCSARQLEEAIDIWYGPDEVVVPGGAAPALEDCLVLTGALSSQQLNQVRQMAEREDLPVAELLPRVGAVLSEAWAEALGLSSAVPAVRLEEYAPSPRALERLPIETATSLGLLPLRVHGPVLLVATVDPTDSDRLMSAARATGLAVRPVVVTLAALAAAQRRSSEPPEEVAVESRHFGVFLVQSGHLNQDQLAEVLRDMTASGRPIDTSINFLGLMGFEAIADALAEFFGTSRVELSPREVSQDVIDPLGYRVQRRRWVDPEIQPDIARQISEARALELGILPVRRQPEGVVVAAAAPPTADARALLEQALGANILYGAAVRRDLLAAVRRIYRHRTLGERLLESGVITSAELDRAIAMHEATGVRLGQALVSMGLVSDEQLALFLADQQGIPFFDLTNVEIDPAVARMIPEEQERRERLLPIMADSQGVTVAVDDPIGVDEEQLERLLGTPVSLVLTTQHDLDDALDSIYRMEYLEASAFALMQRTPELSASRVLSRGQKVFFLAFLVLSGIAIVLNPLVYFVVLIGFMNIFYVTFSGYKFYLAYKALTHTLEIETTPDEVAALDERDLPVYTILIPLYRETAVLPRLIKAIRSLDYPKTKLDVRLLLEEDDVDTIEAARRADLPAHFSLVVVPHGLPKGKPKACNYGLIYARGEYVVIYDAEDLPEPDQLKRVLVAYRKADPRVACIQSKLNYFNRNQNLLTRWFTTEYSMWFDLFLPGLDASNAPIPLGGTSNHFRTEQLRALGAWDPYNVTEDADLGLRLFKAGGRTAIIDSTTYEEANSDLYNWIRQRSRWVKGYIQTYLVHMRHPVRLWKDIGPSAFFSFQMVIAGTFFGFLVNPLLWIMTAAWFLTKAPIIQALFPTPIFYIGAVSLYFGNFAFTYLNVAGCLRREYYDMVKYALLSPIYWSLMSVAAWKGFLQLFYAPSYWEKTDHGLFEGDVSTAPTSSLREQAEE